MDPQKRLVAIKIRKIKYSLVEFVDVLDNVLDKVLDNILDDALDEI